MRKILTLEEGIEQAKKTINQSKRKPILVAVYGLPNSGKSYLIDLLGEYFEKQGISVGRFGGAPCLYTFETIRDRPQVICDLLLFHCGWERYNGLRGVAHEDPNILSEEILGRKLDLSIGIYNPKMYEKVEGEYGLVICNPDSKRKDNQ